MKQKRKSVLQRTAIIAIVVCVPALLFAQNTQEVLLNLSEQIAARRARVEALQEEVQQTRRQYEEEVRSVAAQIADVEVQINREELRLAQIQQDIDQARQSIAAAEDSVADVEPLVLTTLEELRTYIQSALPFQVEDRMEEVDQLERLLDQDTLDAQTILSRLWNTLESEYRLTEESGLFRQTIVVGGEPQLAEVARLGMVMLYFKTFDDRFGYAVPDGNANWSYVAAATREESDQIEALFEALRRNLREGFFTLPNPYEGQ
jgi:DNA repair exonuclease SbcCD ATPase subunit